MKFFVACLIGLALSGAVKIEASPVESPNGLDDVISEFFDLVPSKKSVDLFITYLSYDREFQELVEYYQSDEFKKLLIKVESIKDVRNFLDYVDESGFPAWVTLSSFHDMIGLDHSITDRSARNIISTSGVAGYNKALMNMLPLDDIKALHDEKLKTSPAFANLAKRIYSPKFQELFNAVAANNEFQEINKVFHEHGFDIKAKIDYYVAALGFEDVL